MLFAGEHYYPGGGWEDFKGFFDTPESALEELNRGYLPEWITDPTPEDEESRQWAEWAHIVDTQKTIIIRELVGGGYAPNYRDKSAYRPLSI
jgi:hypothetical protein